MGESNLFMQNKKNSLASWRETYLDLVKAKGSSTEPEYDFFLLYILLYYIFLNKSNGC